MFEYVQRNWSETYYKSSHFIGIWHLSGFVRTEKIFIPSSKKEKVKMVGPATPLIVLFGSSGVQLSYSHSEWGAILTEIYARKADILVQGYNGWNSRRALKVLNQAFPKDAPTQPSLVILYFEGNDSMHPHPSGKGSHVPLPEYIENMRAIATRLKRIHLIFPSCPLFNEEKLREACLGTGQIRTNESCQKYSETCIELCREMDLKVVDLFTANQKMDNWANVCFIAGKIVVVEIWNVLKEAEWEPSLHWKALPSEFGEDSPYDPPISTTGEDTMNFSDWTLDREIQWD